MTAVSTLRSLFENKIFLCTILSMAIAQVLKLFFYLINNKKKKKLEAIETVIWRTGGMPSSHSALVCSLATATGIQEGISSTYFIISLLFALVVLRDSVGVRRASGLQARAINNLGKQLAKFTGQDFHSVKEIHGHTPLEVLVGSCLGILIAVIFFIV